MDVSFFRYGGTYTNVIVIWNNFRGSIYALVNLFMVQQQPWVQYLIYHQMQYIILGIYQ
jgi:hypothetical protein